MTHLLGKKPVVGATIKSSTVGVNRNSYQGSAGFAFSYAAPRGSEVGKEENTEGCME
jgi:hypothetical protein